MAILTLNFKEYLLLGMIILSGSWLIKKFFKADYRKGCVNTFCPHLFGKGNTKIRKNFGFSVAWCIIQQKQFKKGKGYLGLWFHRDETPSCCGKKMAPNSKNNWRNRRLSDNVFNIKHETEGKLQVEWELVSQQPLLLIHFFQQGCTSP